MQINFDKVSFYYNRKSSFEVKALDNISYQINENKVVAFVGKTGSGKSTLVELINALNIPSEGIVTVNGFINTYKKRHRNKEIMNLRKEVGYIFQFPDKQLFEETVLKDVTFGINNFYPKNKDNEVYAKLAISKVGLNESFYSRSPFDLSGGEKKRVAIAGVLAYNPKILILDEPTTGLDQIGKEEIMDLFMSIHKSGVPIILVSHDMDIVLKYADEIVILDSGKIVKNGNCKQILKEDVEKYNLDTPNLYKATHIFKKKGLKINEDKINSLDDLVKEIKNAKKNSR